MKPETTGEKQAGRYAKGTSGNPAGRPKGSRHRLTILAETMMADDADAVISAVLAAAKKGDMSAAKLVLDRVAPLRKGCTVAFTLPSATTPCEILAAFDALIEAVAEGDLTPDEASQVAALLESKRRAVETLDIENRLTKLEERTTS